MSRCLVSRTERSHEDFFLKNNNPSQRELGPPVLRPAASSIGSLLLNVQDYEQSLYFSPSNKTRENAHARY